MLTAVHIDPAAAIPKQTGIVTQVPALALMFFGDVTLELRGVLWALLLAFLIIPINEAYKAIMRAVEKDQ